VSNSTKKGEAARITTYLLKSQTKPIYFQRDCVFPYCLIADTKELNF